MLYSCNNINVTNLEETSRTPGTGDRERLGTEGAVLLPGQLCLRLEMLWAGQGSPAGVL